MDISDNTNSSELRLRILEEQFRGTFESSSIGMAIVGLTGQWIKVNDSLLKILCYDRETLQGLTFQDITHPDDLHADLSMVEELIRGEKDSYQLEKRYFNSNGEIIWVLLSVSIVRDATGSPLHFVSQIIDITESKRIAHLRLSEMDKNINRIAYELHENIAQTLASIKLFLASSRAKKVYEGRDLMGIDRKLSSLISDIQTLTDQIVPTTFIGESLHALINGLVVKHSIANEVRIDLVVDEYLKNLSFPSTYQIFRIVEDQIQSALLRNATVIEIKMLKARTLSISFNDNGAIEKGKVSARISLLLNNIKTRVEMLEGAVKNSADIHKKNGYTISIPLNVLQ